MAVVDKNEPEMAMLSKSYFVCSLANRLVSIVLLGFFVVCTLAAITHWWTHVNALLFAALWLIAAFLGTRQERYRRREVLEELLSSVRVGRELGRLRLGLWRTVVGGALTSVLSVVLIATHNPFVIDHLRSDRTWWFWLFAGVTTGALALDAARRLRVMPRLRSSLP